MMMNGPNNLSSPSTNVNVNNNNQSSSSGNNKIPNSVIGGGGGGGVSAGATSTGGVLNSSGSGTGSTSGGQQQDAMSSLKNIAQEAISRSVGLQGTAPSASGNTSAPSAVPNMMHMSQQQQQQQIQGSNSSSNNNNNLVASLMQQQQQQQERQYGQDVVAMANGNVAQAQSGQQQQQVAMGSSSSSTATTTTMSGGGVGQVGSGGVGTKPGTNVAHIPPLLGVAPLGPSPLQKEHQFQVRGGGEDEDENVEVPNIPLFPPFLSSVPDDGGGVLSFADALRLR